MKWTWIVVSLLLSVAPGLAGDTITLRADIWDPYNGDPASDRPGFMIEVARKVFEKAGYTVDYQVDGWTWERSLEEAKKGSIDGIVGAAKSDAEDFVFPSEALCKQRMSFLVKKGNAWRFSGVDSLSSIRLGVISGYAYDDDIDAYIEKNKDNEDLIQSVQDDNALELNIKKLAAGRIDAVIEDAAVFNTKARSLNLDGQFELAGDASSDDELYIAFSPAKPSSTRYAEVLTAGIKEMKASGELQQLLDKYGIGQ